MNKVDFNYPSLITQADEGIDSIRFIGNISNPKSDKKLNLVEPSILKGISSARSKKTILLPSSSPISSDGFSCRLRMQKPQLIKIASKKLLELNSEKNKESLIANSSVLLTNVPPIVPTLDNSFDLWNAVIEIGLPGGIHYSNKKLEDRTDLNQNVRLSQIERSKVKSASSVLFSQLIFEQKEDNKYLRKATKSCLNIGDLKLESTPVSILKREGSPGSPTSKGQMCSKRVTFDRRIQVLEYTRNKYT